MNASIIHDEYGPLFLGNAANLGPDKTVQLLIINFLGC